MTNKLIDITGNKFGTLTAITHYGFKNGRTLWLFKCDCGNEIVKEVYDVKTGHTSSCGCLTSKLITNKKTKHGHCPKSGCSETYKSWYNMKRRCYEKQNNRYANYGGRGINVCDRWLNSFDNFLLDMGIKPTGCSLERINVNDNYCPQNCKWIENRKQPWNTTKSVTICFNNEIKSLVEWCNIMNISHSKAYQRLRRGWSIDRIFTVP